MKKKIQSVICVLLTVVICFSSASIAFAKESITPVILIHGVWACPIYENLGTSEEKEISNMGWGTTEDVVKGLFNQSDIIFEVLKMLDPARKVSNKKFIDALAEFVKDSNFNPDKNGDIPKNQGINRVWNDSLANHKEYWQDATTNQPAIARQLVKSIGAKNVYAFNYDWRQDICKTADDLNKYIKNVKKNTGAKKVTLLGESLGGSVMSAYMDAYKNNKDVGRYVFVNPAFQGVDVARVYAKDLKIDKKAVLSYLNNLSVSLDAGEQATTFKVITALTDVRIGYAADYLNKLLSDKKSVNRIYKEVLKPLMGNVTSLWECIPYDTFDKAVKEMSAIKFLDKNSGVYKKIKKYHGVQGRLEKNLKAVKKMGAEVAILANYGTMGIPLTSKAYNQTDILIDTKYQSAGATTALIGKKLKAKGKYVSKDKAIDASTCILPDNTWFFKNIQHVRYNYDTQALKFMVNLATGKVKCNITAVKKKYKYSQFLIADSKQNLKNG